MGIINPAAAQYTRGAIRAAEIITQEPFGCSKLFPTTYGRKTVEGIAAIIDNLSCAPELLMYLNAYIELAEAAIEDNLPNFPGIEDALAEARALRGRIT